MANQYRTFEIALANAQRGLTFIEVIALDIADATAQIEEAYFQPRIVTWRQL